MNRYLISILTCSLFILITCGQVTYALEAPTSADVQLDKDTNYNASPLMKSPTGFTNVVISNADHVANLGFAVFARNTPESLSSVLLKSGIVVGGGRLTFKIECDPQSYLTLHLECRSWSSCRASGSMESASKQ